MTPGILLGNELGFERTLVLSENNSRELVHIWIAACFPISPQNSEQRSVFRLNFHLEVHLLNVTNKGKWVAVEADQNIKQFSLKLWPSMNDTIKRDSCAFG